MKTILLHGLGQTPQDWQAVTCQASFSDIDCPWLFSPAKEHITYPHILATLEKRYTSTTQPLCLCGLSLGALLALDYTIRHGDNVASLILIGVQYKVPSRLIDFQNVLFRCMPKKMFEHMGMTKNNIIQLSHSMRQLDFSKNLNNITCPTTIICGDRDKANRKASKQLSRLLPQAELHIIPNAGHEINKCAPQAIVTVLNKQHEII
ncbi:MAG: alpha/beta hydrolase [Clostridium sp.]|nr:alpha/beta hydrolase [Clostridium sp.]MCM1459125.1 alpha/beta hydrolase [Bacteroides sp.]